MLKGATDSMRPQKTISMKGTIRHNDCGTLLVVPDDPHSVKLPNVGRHVEVTWREPMSVGEHLYEELRSRNVLANPVPWEKTTTWEREAFGAIAAKVREYRDTAF